MAIYGHDRLICKTISKGPALTDLSARETLWAEVMTTKNCTILEIFQNTCIYAWCARKCVYAHPIIYLYTWSGQPCALDMWLTSLCFLFSGLLVTRGLTNKNHFIPLLFCTKHTHGRFSNTKSQGYHNLILSLSPFSSVSPAFHGWIAGYQRWVPALDLEIQLVARFSKCDDQLGLFQVLRWDLGSDLDHPRCLR